MSRSEKVLFGFSTSPNMHSKFYEARLIRTMFLVEISLGKEPDLAGFEGKL